MWATHARELLPGYYEQDDSQELRNGRLAAVDFRTEERSICSDVDENVCMIR